MDILSHGLWTNVIFLTARRRDRWWAVAFALLPDLIPFGPFFFEELAVHNPRGAATQFSAAGISYIWSAYQFTHSLVVFAVAFIVVTLFRSVRHRLTKSGRYNTKRPWRIIPGRDGVMWWPLLAWGLHVLTDIPTHRRAFFPTPFLWPFSDYAVDAISWADPRFLIPNLLALVIVYVIIGLYWVRRRRFART